MMQHSLNVEHSFMESFFWNSFYKLRAKLGFKVVVELPLFIRSSDVTVSRDKANNNTKNIKFCDSNYIWNTVLLGVSNWWIRIYTCVICVIQLHQLKTKTYCKIQWHFQLCNIIYTENIPVLQHHKLVRRCQLSLFWGSLPLRV